MSFSELFDSGFKTRNKGHFSAIVRVAMSDGKISEKEKQFLDKLAKELEIDEEEYKDILSNPIKYPVNPPYLYINRLERLYDLGRMVRLDNNLGEKQPEVPLLVLSRIPFAKDIHSASKMAERCRMRDLQRDIVKDLTEAGVKNLHFFDGSGLFGHDRPEEMTVDGVHPTDLGFMHMARVLYPVIAKLMPNGRAE